MFGLGMGEIIVILVIVLLLFGSSRLPEMARALGKAIKEFNKAFKDTDTGQHDGYNKDTQG